MGVCGRSPLPGALSTAGLQDWVGIEPRRSPPRPAAAGARCHDKPDGLFSYAVRGMQPVLHCSILYYTLLTLVRLKDVIINRNKRYTLASWSCPFGLCIGCYP